LPVWAGFGYTPQLRDVQPSGRDQAAARRRRAGWTQSDLKRKIERQEVSKMARTLLLVVAVTGIITLAPGLRAQAGGQTPATQNTGQKNWKDRAEYDLYDAITKDNNPQTKLEKLNQWKEKYAASDFVDQRQEAFLTTYAALGQIQQALDAAKEILARDPNDFTALYYTAFLSPQLVAVTKQQPAEDQLAQAEKASNSILTASKPASLTDAQWQAAKGPAEEVAHKTLGWVAMQRKQPDTAEAEFKKALAANPSDSEVSYWLGIVILQERKPEKQAEALYDYARAAAYDSQGATLAAPSREAVKKQLTDFYTRYHGSTEGLDQILAVAKASPTAAPDFKIVSTTDLEKARLEKEQAEAAANPSLALWKQIKTALTAPDGDTYFNSSMKGTLLPEFSGKVVSMTPALKPKAVVVAIENGTTGDATLKFETPLPGKVAAGTVLKFQGMPESYTGNPFMVTFAVEKSKMTGWTGTNPAPAHKAVHHKAAAQ
jgi:tetratricopeptide (TPR) repeat protein